MADREKHELRKCGVRIKIHDKIFELLLALLDHPGEVILRQALAERLWPGHVCAEVENCLNNAVGRLREVLGDPAEHPRFIETIPRHGYRFLPPPDSRSIPLSRSARAWGHRRLLVALSLVFGAGVAVGALVSRFTARDPVAMHSIAVLPFRVLGAGTAGNSFALGLTDAVTTDLTESGIPKVASELSAARLARANSTAAQIGRALDVDTIIEGAVLRDGKVVRIDVQMIRIASGREIWAASYESSMANVLGLQDQVARNITRAITLRFASSNTGKSLALASAHRRSQPRQL